MEIKKTLKDLVIGIMITSTLYLSGCKKEEIPQYPVIIGGEKYIKEGYIRPFCINIEKPDTIFLNKSKYKKISESPNEIGLEGKFKFSYNGNRKDVTGIIGLGKEKEESFWDVFFPWY